MRIAVTGAGGTLGRRLVARALAAGHEVVATDLPAVVSTVSPGGAHGRTPGGVQWRAADLTVIGEVRAALAGVDAVAHLGAIANPLQAPEPEVHRTNVEGTFAVLLAAEEHGLRAVALASSINAIGGAFSARPRYDRFPVEEDHASYCEDAYSLSKWVGEQQAAAFARRRPDVPISCLRFHALAEDRDAAARVAGDDAEARRHRDLWGWTSLDSAAAACLRALQRGTPGCTVYHVVASQTMCPLPSEQLAARWYPDVPLRAPLAGTSGFYSTARALTELGWDADEAHPAISDAERSPRLVGSSGGC